MEQTIYIADFETRAGEQAQKEEKTWVWGWTITNIMYEEQVWHGSTIQEFFKFIRKTGNSIIYFHNLKFDGRNILDYLLKNGYNHVRTRKEFNEDSKNFMTLIDGSGVFYSITIHNGYRKKIEFRDSFKKAPFSVAKLGKDFKTKYQKTTLDYVLDRPEGYKPDPDELEYMKNDVRVVAEVLRSFYLKGYDRMTIGSDALTTFKDMSGTNYFNNHFPQLDGGEDAFVRKAYRGGWCYVNPKYQARTLHGVGNTYDVNSLYPSMLSSTPYMLNGVETVNIYPCYNGVYYKGEYEFDPVAPLYVCHIRAHFVVKDGYLPTIQLKNNFRFAQNEYITDSEGVEDLYLTSVDYELFRKHYNVYNIEFIDGYKYVGVSGLFDGYINHFMEIKTTTKGAEKAIAKLFLNNLYGKFAQSVESQSKIPYLNEEKQRVQYYTTEYEERKPVYVPVGAFCTAYSRRFTITHAQENYEKFCYADTDSIHCLGEAEGLKIHPDNLCCWKHESTWDSARFLRQKTYMEHMIEEDEKPIDPHWLVKCAGMPQNVKEVFLKDIESGEKTPDDFDIGLSYDNLKLRPKTVEGGVILCTTPFSIK